MFSGSGKNHTLKLLANEKLFGTWQERDAEGRFCSDTWRLLFSHSEFTKLKFNTREDHQQSTLDLMNALFSICEGGLDLPYAASLAAQAAIVPEILFKFASPEQTDRWLATVQSGKVLAAICNSESGTGSNLKGMKSECLVEDENRAKFTATKPLVTNGFGAKYFLVSAWERSSQNPSAKLELFMIDSNEAKSKNVARDLVGFRTGNCGSFHTDGLQINPQASRIGPAGSGVSIFQHCFNFERLYISVLVAGILTGLEEMVLEELSRRPHLCDKQFVQEKIISLIVARTKITALIQTILSRGLDNLSDSQIELSLLKWICSEEALHAVQSASEIYGASTLLKDNVFSKVCRDLSALRFFGGTVELQKMTIFNWSMRQFGSKNAKAA